MKNKSENLLEMIGDKSFVKQIKAKKVSKIFTKCKKNADIIESLKAELSSLPDPEEAVKNKQAELARLESAAAKLQSEITKIAAETRVAKMRIEGRIKLLLADLMESSDGGIEGRNPSQ